MHWTPDSRVKCRKWDDRPLPGARVEVKHDGYRLTVEKRHGGTLYAYGKNPLLCMDLPSHISNWLKSMPNDSVFDGELYLPNAPASEVVTHLKADSTELRYSIFAAPIFAGKDIRYKTCEQRDEIFREHGIEIPRFVVATTEEFSVEKLKEKAALLGIEGFIVKLGHYFSWWKVKPVKTVDCFVTGYTPGLGKHSGKLGSLICAVWDKQRDQKVTIANVGKGNDDEWRFMSPSEILGKVCEVQYEEVQSQGKLKFSSFLRWRDDKLSEDCTLDQLKEDSL